MAATEEPVAWSYEVWLQLKEGLTHSNNHVRSRSAQFLAGLAISDPEKRMLKDFPALWKVTYDSKFVTARHTLQSIWKVGLAGAELKEMVMNRLDVRFKSCEEEKNSTLIRYDIIQGMRNLYDHTGDNEIKVTALNLIETEEESKYRKKYATVWKNT
nr:hypothetical protein [Mesobacillus harenae]